MESITSAIVEADQDAQAHQRQQERGQIEEPVAEQADAKRADPRRARRRRYILVCRFEKFGQSETVVTAAGGSAPSSNPKAIAPRG